MLSFKEYLTESAQRPLQPLFTVWTEHDGYGNYAISKTFPSDTPSSVIDHYIYNNSNSQEGEKFWITYRDERYPDSGYRTNFHGNHINNKCYIYIVELIGYTTYNSIGIRDKEMQFDLAYKIARLNCKPFIEFMCGSLNNHIKYTTLDLTQKVNQYERMKSSGLSDSDIDTMSSI